MTAPLKNIYFNVKAVNIKIPNYVSYKKIIYTSPNILTTMKTYELYNTITFISNKLLHKFI